MLSVRGIGLVSPLGVGTAAAWDRLQTHAALAPPARVPDLAPPALSGGRRMSPWLRMALAASQEALDQADQETRAGLSVFAATGWGSLKHTADFLSNLLRNREAEPQPANFIFSVHNAAATQTAIALAARGANYTLSSVDTGFEQALVMAYRLVPDGHSLVLAGDEVETLAQVSLRQAHYEYGRMPGLPGCQPAEGAAAFWLGPAVEGAVRVLHAEAGLLPGHVGAGPETERDRIRRALAAAGIGWPNLDAVITNAAGAAAWDRGLLQVWDGWPEAAGIPRISYKPWTGEFPSASACGLALTVLSLASGAWPGMSARGKTPKTLLFYNRSRFGFRSMVVLQR